MQDDMETGCGPLFPVSVSIVNEDSQFLCGKHEARLDAIGDDLRGIKQMLERTLMSHEKRLQRLERWRAGLTATTSVLVSYLGIDRLFHGR